jgi:hypothetical protein
MAPRPALDADLDTESRETRKLCSKVGVPDTDLVSSSVELEPRRVALADCRRLPVELVLIFGSRPRVPRRFVWATTGEELATMVDSVGELAGAGLGTAVVLPGGSWGVDAKLLRLEVGLGTCEMPSFFLIFRDLVLNAGGED